MVIKVSSGRQVHALITDLSTGDAAARESAVARLTLIGPRAVGRLIELVGSGAATAARIAALRALEAIADPRALDTLLDALGDREPRVAAAAAVATRSFLRSARGAVAVDRLTGAAIDAARDRRVRVSAIEALGTLEASTLEPLWKALRTDPDPDVRRLVTRAASKEDVSADPVAELAYAAEHDLPDDPAALREALGLAGEAVTLPQLHRIIERVRDLETKESSAARRADWTRVRAAAHAALANRGSRLAVYDLRESLESLDAEAAPLPVEFLAALSRIGDRSCLEAIAMAYAQTGKPGHRHGEWWREHLTAAFRAIVARERITRRHAVMKKIQKRWPDIIESRDVGLG